MYKCLDCGHIFDEGEQAVWTEAHGEQWDGCPICKGGFEETTGCAHCGGEFLETELFDGICAECLAESITYDKGLEYLKENTMLIEFMVGKFYDCRIPIDFNASEKFMNAMEENYLRMKADDLICCRFDFLDCIKEFILKDDGEYGMTHYAEWLNERK